MPPSELYDAALEFNRTLLTAIGHGASQRVLRDQLAEHALRLADRVVEWLGTAERTDAQLHTLQSISRSLRLKLLLARDLGVLGDNAFKDLGRSLDRIAKGLRSG